MLAENEPEIVKGDIELTGAEDALDLSEDTVQSASLDFVGFPLRAAARILDTILYVAVSVLLWLLLFFILRLLREVGIAPFDNFLDNALSGSGTQPVSAALSMFVFVLTTCLAWIVCTRICGMTLGKLICGLIVVKEDGSLLSVWDASKRETAFFLDSFFYGLIAYLVMRDSPKRQRLGDKWGHTVVVRRKLLSCDLLPSKSYVAVGITLSIFVYLIGFSGLVLFS